MAGNEDLFTVVHKGLRSMMYDLSGRLQTNDFADVAATQKLVADLESDFAVARSAGCFLCTFANHADEEERVVFPPTAKFGNALVTALIEEHHELTRQELALGKRGHEILGLASAEERVAAGAELNRRANELLVTYLRHMNREENEMVPLMREHFTDAEQAGMRGRIIGSFPPDRLQAFLGWILPSLNVSELAELMAGLKHGAPPPLVQAVSALAAAKVDPARWADVRQRVGL